MKKVKKHEQASNPFIFFGLCCIAAGILLIAARDIPYYYSLHSFHSETPQTEVKKIPPEVKRILSVTPAAQTYTVPVLLYHYVEYVQDKRDTIRQSLAIYPTTLESQIITLRKAGYTFITAKDLGDALDGKATLSAKPILLTFDDGHRDFFTDVFPILQKYHAKATAYIIPGFTGGSDFMTEEQIAQIAQSNLVDIGAHTVHHLWLAGRPPKTVQDEVQQSKQMLEETYHIHVVSFAYPYGAFDVQAEQVVKDAGFTTAVSTVPGDTVNLANRYFISRLHQGSRTGQALLQYLQQTHFTY